jgi:hypothetical protein
MPNRMTMVQICSVLFYSLVSNRYSIAFYTAIFSPEISTDQTSQHSEVNSQGLTFDPTLRIKENKEVQFL